MLGPAGAVGKTALDLYAGTGAVGIDLLEHGAERVDFVEIDRRRGNGINESVATRGFADKASVYRMDAIKALPRLVGNRYDIVFADPPYDVEPWELLIAGLLGNNLLNPDAWIIAEHRSDLNLPDDIGGATTINRKRYGDTSLTIYAFPNTEETAPQR